MSVHYGIPWFDRDVRQATAEGWDLFQTSGSCYGDRVEIERNDSFEEGQQLEWDTDSDAIDYVATCAMAHSEMHVRAIIIHMRGLDAQVGYLGTKLHELGEL